MKLLLLDAGWDHTPYLVRELAREKFDVTLATPAAPDRWFLARYCHQIAAPWSSQGTEAFAELLDRSDADLILPLSEDIMDMLWKLPEHQTRRLFPPTTPLQRELLRDRTKMYEFASSCGLPVPRMMALNDERDLQVASRSFGAQFVLRGTRGLAGLQVKLIRGVTEAADAYEQLRRDSPGAPFAQEYIEGPRYLVGGLFHKGSTLQMFSQTTVEALRPPTGPSIRIKSVMDPVLWTHTKSVFRGLSWTGLACAEFIRDRSGEYRFLEINPRPWAAIYAAHFCGVPLLRTFALYLKGDRTVHPMEVPDARDVVLFPQFISARVASEDFPRMRDLRYYMAALKGAPWSSPALLLHLLRRVFWSRKG